eukprot:TRINITY_DN2384_c0_g1_i1.p1 TRINITY_DN2384_c0_g1~~TRINITY_DN2384_c0_g1_i1.p1  ORF type:complete len:370 (+),score=114.84 TRINITY_DN2384_c0_g1_i1:952-2061(+)
MTKKNQSPEDALYTKSKRKKKFKYLPLPSKKNQLHKHNDNKKEEEDEIDDEEEDEEEEEESWKKENRELKKKEMKRKDEEVTTSTTKALAEKNRRKSDLKNCHSHPPTHNHPLNKKRKLVCHSSSSSSSPSSPVLHKKSRSLKKLDKKPLEAQDEEVEDDSKKKKQKGRVALGLSAYDYNDFDDIDNIIKSTKTCAPPPTASKSRDNTREDPPKPTIGARKSNPFKSPLSAKAKVQAKVESSDVFEEDLRKSLKNTHQTKNMTPSKNQMSPSTLTPSFQSTKRSPGPVKHLSQVASPKASSRDQNKGPPSISSFTTTSPGVRHSPRERRKPSEWWSGMRSIPDETLGEQFWIHPIDPSEIGGTPKKRKK